MCYLDATQCVGYILDINTFTAIDTSLLRIFITFLCSISIHFRLYHIYSRLYLSLILKRPWFLNEFDIRAYCLWYIARSKSRDSRAPTACFSRKVIYSAILFTYHATISPFQPFKQQGPIIFFIPTVITWTYLDHESRSSKISDQINWIILWTLMIPSVRIRCLLM